MRLHVVVHGRVQGVGFRWFVHEEASDLGLAGWVKNRRDGAVEVEAEGDGAAITQLRERLATGPHGASVVSLEDLPASTDPLDHPFSIVR